LKKNDSKFEEFSRICVANFTFFLHFLTNPRPTTGSKWQFIGESHYPFSKNMAQNVMQDTQNIHILPKKIIVNVKKLCSCCGTLKHLRSCSISKSGVVVGVCGYPDLARQFKLAGVDIWGKFSSIESCANCTIICDDAVDFVILNHACDMMKLYGSKKQEGKERCKRVSITKAFTCGNDVNGEPKLLVSFFVIVLNLLIDRFIVVFIFFIRLIYFEI
jgi:hypothetical protein